MKYFIDTEFIEGPQDKRFMGFKYGQTKPTIDLISIGIVAEDGREYYAVSKDFNLKEAWNKWDYKKTYSNLPGDTGSNERKVYWIRENVLQPIHYELSKLESGHELDYGDWQNLINRGGFYEDKRHYRTLRRLIRKYGKSNKQIAKEIKNALYSPINSKLTLSQSGFVPRPGEINFYGYFADYDWVVFCWLFGLMKDLPKGFPMYCKDLEQMLDEKKESSWKEVEMSTWGHEGITDWKKHPDYPKQTNEHNALADARWNKELYEFLSNIRVNER